MKPVLLGICGGSGSGKSTLARAVIDRLGHDSASGLAFDIYYRDHGHLSVEERAAVNYDHPDSLDAELFIAHLDDLASGKSVEAPVYDFATHTRSNETTTIAPRPVVVVEGILILAFPEIANRFALRVFRDCDETTRFERRLSRDVAERGRSPESVREQFAATVKPMHDFYVQPSAETADLVIDGTGRLEHRVDEVLAALGPTN